MSCSVSRISQTALVAVCVLTLGPACFAQAIPTATETPDSKVDFYAGYGYFHPVNSDIGNHPYLSIHNQNVTSNLSIYLSHYVGFQIEASYFDGPSVLGVEGQCLNLPCYRHDPLLYTAEAGPVFRYPLGRWAPYVHALGGSVRNNGPVFQTLTTGWGVTAGVGVDYVLPYFHNRFAIRPIQADFQFSEVNHGVQSADGTTGGTGDIFAAKLSGGLVVRFGVATTEARPVEIGCVTQPMSVFPGEPVAANGSIVNLNPKKVPVFTWTSSGGVLTPHDSSATIDTTGLAPGDYTVKAQMSSGKKPTDQSSCTAPFTVKAFDPPTLRCSASPASVTSGETVDIDTTGMSPQNRPLTYSFSASAGQISSIGPTAKLSTAGLGATTITVSCNLVDDLGKTASAQTIVNVQALPPPVVATTQALCGISFERDRNHPVRVNNEAKGCLDDVALALNQRADAQLFIVANSSTDDHPGAAAERALNIRQYLTMEKGIDPTRIYVRTGDTSGRTARTVLAPAGAVFEGTGSRPFDEASIKRHGPAYSPGNGAVEAKHTPAHHHRTARLTDTTPATAPK
jgi:hypothetical protein